MSITAAKAFVDKMKADQELAKKISECVNGEELIKVINDAGFDYTLDELQECTDLLADADLDKVVGGGRDCSYQDFRTDPNDFKFFLIFRNKA